MARRLAAIMAGDVVGYTRLMAEDEDGTYDSLRAALDEVVVPGRGGAWRPGVQDHGRRLPRRASAAPARRSMRRWRSRTASPAGRSSCGSGSISAT